MDLVGLVLRVGFEGSKGEVGTGCVQCWSSPLVGSFASYFERNVIACDGCWRATIRSTFSRPHLRNGQMINSGSLLSNNIINK
jgi:hypothetical protein